jgi:hypothetical protein
MVSMKTKWEHMLIRFTLFTIIVLWRPELVHSGNRNDCGVHDAGQYYDVSPDRTYDMRQSAESIAQALYRGPLMREGKPWGIANLMRSLDGEQIPVRRIQKIIREHLYGESDEFRNLLARLEDRYGTEEASHRILKSLCMAFGLTPRSRDVAARDACLTANGKAHWVVTKMIVAYLELAR